MRFGFGCHLLPLKIVLIALRLMSVEVHSQTVPSATVSAADTVQREAASISALPEDRPFECVHFFGQDLREARKPRLRGERPTKQSIESDSTTASLLSEVDLDKSHCKFLFGSLEVAVLAGHPSELLRPPSLSA